MTTMSDMGTASAPSAEISSTTSRRQRRSIQSGFAALILVAAFFGVVALHAVDSGAPGWSQPVACARTGVVRLGPLGTVDATGEPTGPAIGCEPTKGVATASLLGVLASVATVNPITGGFPAVHALGPNLRIVAALQK